MPHVQIRPALPSDAEAIAALHVAGWQEFRAFVPAGVVAARTHARGTQEWRQRLKAADPRWWTAVAEHDAHPVGFVGVEHLAPPALGANSEIHNLFVASAWRRHGVGRRLLAAAAEWIASVSAEPISLYSFTENRHRAAYTHLGGRIVGERQSTWDGVVIPETCYVWATAADLIAHASVESLK
jgi:GNAT superfamily N-acetyltransferase